MTLREEVLKQSVISESDYYTKGEVKKIITEVFEEVLNPIRSRISYFEDLAKNKKLEEYPEKKEYIKNVLTMLKSTEKMIDDTCIDYLRKNGF